MGSVACQSPHKWRWSISPGSVQLPFAFRDRVRSGSFQCALHSAIPVPRSTSTPALYRANSSQSQRKPPEITCSRFLPPSEEKKRVLVNGLPLLSGDCEQL